MHAIRSALGSIGIGHKPADASTTGTTCSYVNKCEITLNNLRLMTLPDNLTRNKFEPYLCVRRGDDTKSGHNTFTKKDLVLTSAVIDPIVYNDKFEIDVNQDDILKVILFNGAHLIRADTPVAEGFINVRDIVGGMPVGTGGLINSRAFDLPLYMVPEAAASGSQQHGLMGMLPGRHGAHGQAAPATGTTATGTSAMGTSAMGTTAPGTMAPGAQIGLVSLSLCIFDNAARSAVNAAGMTGTTSTAVPAAAVGGAALGAGAVGAAALAGRSSGGGSGVTSSSRTSTASTTMAGQYSFNVRLNDFKLDYGTVERLYSFRRLDIDSKLAPYVLIMNNTTSPSVGGMPSSMNVRSNVGVFDRVSGTYKFDGSVMNFNAAQTDQVVAYLCDDNLISRDSYLGYCLLPLSTMMMRDTSGGAIMPPASSSATSTAIGLTGMGPTSMAGTGGSIGFQELQFQAMDPKNNRSPILPATGAPSFGSLGFITMAISPSDQASMPSSGTSGMPVSGTSGMGTQPYSASSGTMGAQPYTGVPTASSKGMGMGTQPYSGTQSSGGQFGVGTSSVVSQGVAPSGTGSGIPPSYGQ